MKQIDIHISLTEFVNFINASGMAKMTIVSNAKMRHEDEGNPFDYWKDFKDEVIKQMKRRGEKEDLWELVENVREDMRDNYNQMISGYVKFWKPTRMEWLNPVKKMVHLGGVKMILNPEIGVKWHGKNFMIKLYMKANERQENQYGSTERTYINVLFQRCLYNYKIEERTGKPSSYKEPTCRGKCISSTC